MLNVSRRVWDKREGTEQVISSFVKFATPYDSENAWIKVKKKKGFKELNR